MADKNDMKAKEAEAAKAKEADAKKAEAEKADKPKEMPKAQPVDQATTGSIPGKSESHPPVIAGEPAELGNESVPGADPDQPGMGFEVIPNKSEDHQPVMMGEPHEIGDKAVPGTKKKDWQIIPGKTEDHAPVINGEPAELGNASVPAPPVNEAKDADDSGESARSADKKSTKLRLIGFKKQDGRRSPSALTLIMPDDEGKKQDKAGAMITSGATLVVRRDMFREFSAEEAKWLEDRGDLEFEKA